VVPALLKTAYAAVADMVKDNPILQIQSAQDNRGRFISYAVDFGLQRAIEAGALDCDCRWRSFAKPTGRYLELRFSHSTASVSQVAVAAKQPRNVVFRDNARLNNQRMFDFEEFRDELWVTGVPHFLLVHGHQSLDFAHFGVPSSTSKTRYSWLSPNLMNLPHEVVSNQPKAEDTDFNLDDLNLLKEDIDKWRRDNGDE